MVQAVSFRNVPAYQQFYSQWQKSSTNLAFISWCESKGYTKELFRQIENYIETGDPYNGREEVDTIAESRQMTKGRNTMFQSEDAETFYEFDWDSGSYSKINDKKVVAQRLGLDASENFDTLSLGYNRAVIADYKFGNLSDGQDTLSTKTIQSQKYGARTQVVTQEFDWDYIFNTALADPSDPQYVIAKNIFDNLVANAAQWMTAADFARLDKIEAQNPEGVESAEYKNALKDIMKKNLDLGVWTDHEHTRSTGAGFDGTNEVGSVDNVEGKVPEYATEFVIEMSGLSADYYTDSNWYGSKHYDSNAGDGENANAKNDAVDYVNKQLSNYITCLIKILGSEATQEIQEYMIKAKNIVLQSDVIDRNSGKTITFNYWAQGKVNIKDMIDKFEEEFKNLCKNKGKTDTEVATAKAEKQKELEEKESSYKALYDIDAKSEAKTAGVKDTYQVINAKTADDFRDEAEAKILEPLISQVKKSMSGQNLSNKELNAILDYALEVALADPEKWVTQDNNYKYTINSGKVTELFDAAIKSAIKTKGYNF